MDPVYAANIGVDIDELLISQPDTGEQALEITDMLVRSGALDVIVIDSVAALTPRAEIEGEMGDSHVGLQARLMSQALRKLTANLNKSDTICIFINQLREKIGVMFGSPGDHPGWSGAQVLLARSASTSAASRPSRTVSRSWATAPGSRWSRTRSPRRSGRPSSTSCTARASAVRARCSTSASTSASSRSPVPGTPTRASSSARAGRTPRPSSPRTPRSWWRSPSGSSRRRSASASRTGRRRRPVDDVPRRPADHPRLIASSSLGRIVRRADTPAVPRSARLRSGPGQACRVGYRARRAVGGP